MPDTNRKWRGAKFTILFRDTGFEPVFLLSFFFDNLVLFWTVASNQSNANDFDSKSNANDLE